MHPDLKKLSKSTPPGLPVQTYPPGRGNGFKGSLINFGILRVGRMSEESSRVNVNLPLNP